MTVTRARAKSRNGHIIQSYITDYVRELEDTNTYVQDYKPHGDSTVFSHIMEYLKLKIHVASTTIGVFELIVHPLLTVYQLKQLCAKTTGCIPWTTHVYYNHYNHYNRHRMVDIGLNHGIRKRTIRVCPCAFGPVVPGVGWRMGPPPPRYTGRPFDQIRADSAVRRLRKQGILQENITIFFMECKLNRLSPFSGRALTRSRIKKKADDVEKGWVK
jgi:hypothetical protein